MTCPDCRRSVRFLDVKLRRCPSCEAKICVPKRYFRPAMLLGVAVTIVTIVKTFSTFFTSPPSFPLVMLWLVILVLVQFGATLLSMVSIFISPPTVETPHANDDITVLRLHD